MSVCPRCGQTHPGDCAAAALPTEVSQQDQEPGTVPSRRGGASRPRRSRSDGSSREPAPPKIFGSRYEVTSRIGRGAMGSVYAGLDNVTDEKVAIKVLLPEAAGDAQLVRRFEREAVATRSLRHPNVVEVRDFGHDPHSGAAYLVMELLAGESLSSRLARGPLPPVEAVDIARQVLAALQVAHQRGVVHRDLKPGNLFLCPPEKPQGRLRAKVLDFGVAKLLTEQEQLTRHGTRIGTPAYMAPEQARGEIDIDGRTDLYTVGVILFAMVTARRPFEGHGPVETLVQVVADDPPSPREYVADLPAGLEDVILKAMQKKPDDRYQSALEFADALDHWAEARESDTQRTALPAKLLASAERRLVTVVLADRVPSRERFAALMKQYGGTPEVLLGGVCLALFGVDLCHGDEPVRAVRAALALQRLSLGEPEGSTASRAPTRRPPDGEDDDDDADGEVKIGVGTGRVHQGQRAARREVVANAARLCERAPDGSILVDRETFRRTRGTFRGRALALPEERPRPVTGMLAGRPPSLDESAKISAYEVFEERPYKVSLGGREVLGVTPELVGRARERRELAARVAALRTTPWPQGLVIVGDAGSGKSRLREELAALCADADDPPVYLEGRCELARANAPFSLFSQVVVALCGLEKSEDEAEARAKVRSTVENALAAGSALSPQLCAELVGALCGVQFPDGRALQGLRRDPGALRERTLSAVAEVIAGSTAIRPVVLVLEDLHWGDAPSRALAQRLITDPPAWGGNRLLLVVLARPELLDRDVAPLGAEAPIWRLGPLGQKDTTQLIRSLLQGDVDADICSRITALSGGNPFFIEEIVQALVESGALSRHKNVWLLEQNDLIDENDPLLMGGRQDSAAVAAVDAIIQARLDRLPKDEKEVLKRASVIGKTFLADGLVGLGVADPLRPISRLLGRDLLVASPERPGEYQFRHDLLRDVAYGLVPPEERARLHRNHALELDRTEAAGAGGFVAHDALMARHFELGGDGEAAARAYLKAALRARDAFDFPGASSYVERGLKLTDEPEVKLDLLSCRAGLGVELGQSHEARRDLDAMRSLLARGGEPRQRALASLLEGRLALTSGEGERAQGFLLEAHRRFAALAGAQQAVAREAASGEVESLHLLSLVAQHEGRYADQLKWAEKAYQTAARGENQQLTLGALSALATAHGSCGALDRALEVEESALALARELGDPQRLAHALYGLGWLRNCIGAYPEAKTSLEEAIELGRQSGNRRAEAYALHNVGLSYLRTGDPLRAIAAEEAAIEIGERTENQRVIAVSKLYMAFILTEMAQTRGASRGAADVATLNQALSAARATIAIAAATAMPYLEAVARAAVAHALLLRETVDEALEEAEEAMGIRDRLEGIDENEELVLWVHHLVLRRAERWQQADEAGARARSFILERASRLKDQRVRTSYLTRVPLHAAIFGVGPGPDGKIGPSSLG